MEYSPQQVRRIVGISGETLRYWRHALSPLAAKSGKAAPYSVGEILALTIVNLLVRTHKMDIGAISPIADRLFDACHQPLRFARPTTLLWIDLESSILAPLSEPQLLPTDRLGLVVPISHLWRQLSASLTASERPDDQQELLPLASVR